MTPFSLQQVPEHKGGTRKSQCKYLPPFFFSLVKSNAKGGPGGRGQRSAPAGMGGLPSCAAPTQNDLESSCGGMGRSRLNL